MSLQKGLPFYIQCIIDHVFLTNLPFDMFHILAKLFPTFLFNYAPDTLKWLGIQINNTHKLYNKVQ